MINAHLSFRCQDMFRKCSSDSNIMFRNQTKINHISQNIENFGSILTIQNQRTHLRSQMKKVVRQLIDTCLFYARAVDCTILPSISSIASEQANAKEGTEKRIKQLLTGRNTSKQATTLKNGATWVLRGSAYPRALETRNAAGTIYIGCE